MSADRTILVCGATGRQGGAVARRLLTDGWRVRVLTRHPTAAAAQALRHLGADVVTGDLGNASSLVAAMAGVHGVFGVTDFWEHGLRGEVAQGKNLIDASRTAGAAHVVFSSVGGTERTEGLGIRHFDSKREIERHLRGSGLTWTILRPVTFFENFVSRRYRSAICERGLFRFCIEPDKPFQMVAMADVAFLAARAFQEPGTFGGVALEVASDRLTMLDFCQVLARAVGRPVRYQYLNRPVQGLVAYYVALTRRSGQYKVGPSLLAQFRWNNRTETGGWDADLTALRVMHPGLFTADEWARTIDWRAGLE